MSGFYAGLASKVLKLMRAKGQTMYLVRRASSAYDAATSSAAALPEVREKVYGLELALPTGEQPGQSPQRADKTVYLEAINPTTDPQTYDGLEIGGTVHEILTSKPLSPAGLAVLHELRVRGGG